MPKILITSPCQVNFGDERGGVHADDCELVTVTKDVAQALVRSSRALYVEKKDDPDKHGRDTASAEMLKAAETVRKSRASAAKASTVVSPAGGGAGNPDTPPA